MAGPTINTSPKRFAAYRNDSSSIAPKKSGFEGQRLTVLTQAKRKTCSKHPFIRNLYITDIGFFPRAATHRIDRKQGCSQYILIYCVNGEGWYTIENKTYLIKANQFIIIPAGISHKYGADANNPWTIYWVHFTGSLAPFYHSLLIKDAGFSPVNTSFNTTRLLLFEDSMEHMELMNDIDNIIYGNSCLYAFLATFQVSQMKISKDKNDVIQQCITFMKKNIHKNLSLEELSKNFDISSSHLSAIFSQRMKYSPIQLFTSLKIQRACQLLMDGRNSIKSIANHLGYEDPYHFSRVFKNTMGLSPKFFRKAGGQ